jgi:hypothetical protein
MSYSQTFHLVPGKESFLRDSSNAKSWRRGRIIFHPERPLQTSVRCAWLSAYMFRHTGLNRGRA